MRKIEEGYMPFKGYQTYYRIVGERQKGKVPLLLLHGGPGSTHNYFEVLDSIADTGHQVIMYDQLGCGNSYVEGHPELWTLETWEEELRSLRDYLHIDECHLLGQSWGGMLLIAYLIDGKAEGVRSAILSSTLSASWLWGHEQHRLIAFMSPEDQRAIAEAEAKNDYSSPEYQLANEHFMLQHCAGEVTANSPECLRRPKKSGAESYLIGWGPNEYTPMGTLKDFDYTDRLKEIAVPCLVISGTNDLCTPLVAKTMYDGIPDSRWELFDGARHMVFAEQTEKYTHLLSQWLEDKD
ncbi:MAG: proline iminopeptidase-family hydrolase [Prevotella sp.]|jgi:proline iminopeptidase|nr:proline iminopeptidase-family hydrolase [Prevotella sp.]MCI2079556.1 proline iminopeptidase-family hydrolase [Prevotella sp.]MCI2101587.1 proline iminopeptidase-family hydrolase [Prevotella sp.]